MIDNLVTKDEYRIKTLKALAKGFARENVDGDRIEGDPWSADFVKGKGKGLIFLLHGKPGVGKTYTAGNSFQFETHVKKPCSLAQAWPSPDPPSNTEKKEHKKKKKKVNKG